MSSGRPASVFFYISGHRFGHSIRQIEIINALLASAPAGLSVCIRTSAPPWLFTRAIAGPVALLPAEVDTGVVQIDSLRLDETATMENAAAFYDCLARRVEEEAALLKRHAARLVVADAPPLACAAAAAAGIPSIVCANFTWDWIYEAYREAAAAAPAVIARIRELYSLAAAGWRLPMHGGFDTIPALQDVPLVARQPSTNRSPDEIRAVLNLPAAARLALVSFGGYGVRDLPLTRLDCTSSWTVVVPTAAPVPADSPGVIALNESLAYARGLRYQDLVRAVDVVVSKPGYGIISDCIASGTALLYTSRGRFAEYDVLVREMPRLLRCRFIALDDFLAGRWREALDSLHAAPPPREKPSTGGAQAIAGMIAGTVRPDED